MDTSRIIEHTCPQIADDTLWHEFLQAVGDLSENPPTQEVLSYLFVNRLTSRGFLKAFSAEFVAVPGKSYRVIKTNLPPGKYVAKGVRPLNSASLVFDETQTTFTCTEGYHDVYAVDFEATEFTDKLINTFGPGIFQIANLKTLLEAAYVSGTSWDNIKFVSSTIDYSISTRFNSRIKSKVTTIGKAITFSSLLDLIPYQSDNLNPHELRIGDLFIPTKMTESGPDSLPAVPVLSFTNGIAVCKMPTLPEGCESIEDWFGTNEDTSTIQRYLNGYTPAVNEFTTDNEILLDWWERDKPIRAGDKLNLSIAVNPLNVQLEAVSGSSAGVSVSGFGQFLIDLSSLASWATVYIDGQEVQPGRFYQAPATLQVVALEPNNAGTARESTFELISNSITFTVTVNQQVATIYVDLIQGEAATRLLEISSSTVESPIALTNAVPSSTEITELNLRVASYTHWMINATLTAYNWVANEFQSITFIPEVQINPSSFNPSNQMVIKEVTLRLPGYIPKLINQGNGITWNVSISIGGKSHNILSLTNNANILSPSGSPLRFQGGAALTVITRDNATVAIGGFNEFSTSYESDIYTLQLEGGGTESGIIYYPGEPSGSHTLHNKFNAIVAFFVGHDSDFTDLEISPAVIKSTEIKKVQWSDVGVELGALHSHGVAVLKTSLSGYQTALLLSSKTKPLPSIIQVWYKEVNMLNSSGDFTIDGFNAKYTNYFSTAPIISNTMPVLPPAESGSGHTDETEISVPAGYTTGLQVFNSQNHVDYIYADNNQVLFGAGDNSSTGTRTYTILPSPTPKVLLPKASNYRHELNWVARDLLSFEIPAGTILILAGYGPCAFPNTADPMSETPIRGYNLPFSFIDSTNNEGTRIVRSNASIAAAHSFPAYFNPNSQDGISVNDNIMDAIRRFVFDNLGIASPEGVPRGNWNAWYSGSYLIALSKTPSFIQWQVRQYFNQLQSFYSCYNQGTTVNFYGLAIPTSWFDSSDIDNWENTQLATPITEQGQPSWQYTPRTMKYGVVYNPYLDLASELYETPYYIREARGIYSRINAIIGAKLLSGDLTKNNLVTIPINVKSITL